MNFKTVFFAMGSAQDGSELDRVIEICQGLDAHLSVLVVGVAPPPPASPYGVVSNDIWAGEIREGQGEAKARADAVEESIAAAGLSCTVEAQYVDRGTVSTLAARFARYADLTIISPQAENVDLMQSWVMNGALFESGRPILILPKGPFRFPAADRVIIAWDASVEASKAVRDSMDLLAKAKQVDAVLIDPVPSFEGHGAEPGADLAAYLARHGISAMVHRLPKQGKDVGDILRRAAVDFGADLIVMGGFGHSRLRQRIFGGTTTIMMKETSVPVLMAH